MSPEEQRRANALRQLAADAEFEQQQAARRPTLATAPAVSALASAPAVRPVTAAAPALAPAPTASASATLGNAVSALRGRSAEAMAGKYGFARGTAFVEGPPGHDKVNAKLTRGEAVLPQKTVGAMGGPGAVARLIKQTTGHSPQRGFKKHGKTKAASGLVADESYEDFDVPVGAAPTKFPAGAARRVSAGTVGQSAPRGNFSDGTMDAAPTGSYLDARQRGGLPAEIGMRARDIVGDVGSTLSLIPKAALPVANTLKTAFTGDPTPINFNLSPEAQAASGTAPSGAGNNSPLAPNQMTHRQMENGSPVSAQSSALTSRPLGYGGITEMTTKSGRKSFTNLDATGVRVDGGTPYTAADGTPTARWEDTQAYQDATVRAKKDQRDADMLSVAQQLQTRSGAEGERQKDATIAMMRLGMTPNKAPTDADLEGQAEASQDKSLLVNLRRSIARAKTPEEAARLQQSYLTLAGKSPKDYFGEVKGGSRTDELGNKTEDPGQMVNLLTGQAAGAQKRVATKAQVKRLMTELGLPSEQEAVAYLASRGVTVEG